MKSWIQWLWLSAVVTSLHAQVPQLDWERAREVHRRASRGETLSSADQKYYDEARKQFPGRSERRSDEASRNFVASETAKDLVPLSELTGMYRQWDGGLYGAGSNEVPAAQQVRATQALACIQPLDAEGKTSPDGKIVLLSIGMSNTTREFSTFVQAANADPRKSTQVVVVDGTQGGKAAQQWAAADAQPWSVANERLQRAGVTPAQVQVLWIKQANIAPNGSNEAEVAHLQADLQTIVTLAKVKYPQARLAFLSSRIYAGFAQTRLNPEPFAYEGAFAMRGLIQQQMGGDPLLAVGKAPVLLWGPYLWGAGTTARKADGLVWKPEDFAGDGTHPSASGAQKVSALLLSFFTTDVNAKPWFVTKP